VRLADVGAGAGFPGLALKLALPNLHVVLVEATRKKTEFLAWIVNELDLRNVEVLAERAESVGLMSAYRETFDVATARAVGALNTVLELTLPLCRIGGVVLAPRGANAVAEAGAASQASGVLGGGTPRSEPTPSIGVAERTSVVIVRKTDPTPARYPRREGMPGKKPLL
jgi:16S rRNA (guanine527-N7)-methyltransferase